MLEVLVPPTPEQKAAAGTDFDDRAAPGADGRGDRRARRERPESRLVEARGQQRPARRPRSSQTPPRRQPRSAAWYSGAGRTATASSAGSRPPQAVGSFVGFAVGRTLWTDPFAALVRGRDRRARDSHPDRGRVPGYRVRLPDGTTGDRRQRQKPIVNSQKQWEEQEDEIQKEIRSRGSRDWQRSV